VRWRVCEECRDHVPTVRPHRTERLQQEQRPPDAPDLEPLHDFPWVARSSFTGRTRHSPRS